MYQLPTFNLVCSIWRYTTWQVGWGTSQGDTDWPPALPADLADVECNLAWGRRVSSQQGLNNYPSSTLLLSLLLPPLTDIRDSSSYYLGDVVEVPQGSGRVYLVADVDDIGKGFANEHRAASLLKFGFCDSCVDSSSPDVRYWGVQWPGPIP